MAVFARHQDQPLGIRRQFQQFAQRLNSVHAPGENHLISAIEVIVDGVDDYADHPAFLVGKRSPHFCRESAVSLLLQVAFEKQLGPDLATRGLKEKIVTAELALLRPGFAWIKFSEK